METITEDIISKRIKCLNDLGFKQIRIPGGSSIDEEHYAGTFLYRMVGKQMEFLGVPYNPEFYKTHESNGHTKKRGEIPTATARREVYEETGFLVNESDLELVHSFSIPNRKDQSKMHVKYFYLTSRFSGTLSDFGDEHNPIDHETGTPLWIPYFKFKNVLYEGHQHALNKAVNYLKKLSVEYYYALS